MKIWFGQNHPNFGQLCKIFGQLFKIFGQQSKNFGHFENRKKKRLYFVKSFTSTMKETFPNGRTATNLKRKEPSLSTTQAKKTTVI
ncbi:hypothetical protein EKQ44_11665 [Sutcliffiella horikoshii]|nr:hypothetical protein [Sutcliffiella horikoshii]